MIFCFFLPLNILIGAIYDILQEYTFHCNQIEKYTSWLVKIFTKFLFTSGDLNEKPLATN